MQTKIQKLSTAGHTKRLVCDGLVHLSAEDIRNLKQAARPRKPYALPRFNRNGEMIDAQWQSWKKLQKHGLAEIESPGAGAEAEDLVITAKGRRALKVNNANEPRPAKNGELS